MKLSQEDKQEFERLLSLKKAQMQDKQSALKLLHKYDNDGLRYCMMCQASVRQMFKRLRSCYEGIDK